MPTIHELRLPRFTHAMGDLHRLVPAGGTILFVRFTRWEMIAVYRMPSGAPAIAPQPI